MSLTELTGALHDIRIIRYSELASSMIIVYDHLITFNDELELIWNSSLSLGKCLFLVNRYYALVSVFFNNYALFSPSITDSVSLHWYKWQGWTGVVTFVLAEMILQLRLYALYFFSKKVLIIMASTCIIATAFSAVVMGWVLSGISASSDAIPGIKFCVATGVSHHFWTFWVPMLVSESVLCVLALYRGFENYYGGTLFRTGKRLVEVLIRDSVFYFVVMFATYLVNAIVFIVGTSNEVEVPIGFAVALSCVLGNRLCLNVRGMIRHDYDDSLTTMTAPSAHRLDFAHSPPRPHARPSPHPHIHAHHREANIDFWDRTELSHIEMTDLREMRAEP
ncbi:hypothetical protein SCP_0602260 [Sparassis crispa]|uniref:DUF6533 domain-containing protein n=1 Tax=Sparassis crispa TaxID=139825 RepID=A0A401GPV5_9APHY|nr:hypothetical protein SCP_0602260 [Sparassis crispa]GBE84248.1 hypothetical protein SCP_0602260 [Sparassis crispa]